MDRNPGVRQGGDRFLSMLALLFLFGASFCRPAASQGQWDFQYMKSPDGVPLVEVRDLSEDASGQIWVATWGNGVARLGATEWLTLNEDKGLTGDWVRGLAIGQDNTVWISTADGLCLYSEERLTCYAASEFPAIPTDNLDTVHGLPSGDILLGSREGHILLGRGASQDALGTLGDPARWSTLCEAGQPRATRLVDVYENRQGELWLSHRGGEVHLHHGGSYIFMADPPSSVYFAGTPEMGLWAGDWNGHTIYHWSGTAWEVSGESPEEISSLLAGRDGWLYIGTDVGLYRKRGTTIEEVDLGESVGRPHIVKMLESADGALWLGAQEGLIRGAPESWEHFGKTRDGKAIVELVSHPDKKGELLAVDAANGLSRFTAGGWKPFLYLDTTEVLQHIQLSPTENCIWAIGGNYVHQFSLEDGRLISKPNAPSTNAGRSLFVTGSGEVWFLAPDGVHAWRNGAWVPVPEASDYDRRRVYAIAETEPGVYFTGLTDGIERWRGGQVEHFGEAYGVDEGDEAHEVYASRDGRVWFGTFGSGVYYYDGEQFHNFGLRDGLAHHSVSSILETRDGAIWIAYRRAGVASFKDGRWLNYGSANGLPNASIIAMHEDKSGYLWLQSEEQGLYRYRPDITPPETYLEGATREVPSRGIGVFSFSAEDGWQRTPKHLLLYSWQLLNAQTGAVEIPWSQYLPRSTFITPTLRPGAYIIEARASDDARNPDLTPAQARFEVFPPIWRQPGVYLPACLLAVLLLAAVGLRARANRDLRRSKLALSQSNRQLMSEIRERLVAEQRLNEHFEQLEELVKGRTADLEAAQRALVQQERLALLGKVTASVSHELRNPLGTLRSTLFSIGRKVEGKNLGLEQALERAERSIKRCDRIIEEFLDFTRTVSMERECINMDQWLAGVLEEMEIPESISGHYTYESAISLAVDGERLRRAVINVVNNAVQAMLEQDSEFKRLRIKSRVRSDRFEIVVKDNGPGIPEESMGRIFEPLYSTKGFGVGLGMPIVKDIMEKHEGGVEYHSVVDKGTTVVLWIPMPPEGCGQVAGDSQGC